MKPVTLTLRVQRALQVVPMTILELAGHLRVSDYTVRRTVRGLVSSGMVRDSGMMKNGMGRPAVIFCNVFYRAEWGP
jgi:predicted ArsR family transcriptional regulator